MDIRVPDLGDFADVEVIELLVTAGDTVAAEDGLITVETDKASMDIPAPVGGRIEALTVAVGDTVSTGDVIGRMIADAPAGAEKTAEETAEETAEKRTEETAGADQAAAPAADTETAAATFGGGEQTLAVPDIGDFSDVEVIEVHVAAGDRVGLEDPLVTLETDKAAMDVPAVFAGTVRSVRVSVGDKVSEGSPLVVIDAEAAADDATVTEKVPPAPAAPPLAETPRQTKAPAAASPGIDEAGFARAHASPSVRKLARELGVDLVRVKGTGPRQRILHDDLKAFVKAAMSGAGGGGTALPATPKIDHAKFGAIELEPLTRVQKISGPRLQASWINLPHVTQHDLADITELEARRQELKGPAKERGISLTPLAFVMKACVAALREYPRLNSSLADDGEHIVVKDYIHLGFAADTPQGLMVPVIRNVERKDVYEIAAELGELSLAAREGKLKADQMQGASFTISSLGGVGGTAFTPIVNAPEVAILGVSRSSMQPVWDGTAFQPRLMLPLSLSYDHRVIDGAMAVRFTTFLGAALGDVDSLLKAIP